MMPPADIRAAVVLLILAGFAIGLIVGGFAMALLMGQTW